MQMFLMSWRLTSVNAENYSLLCLCPVILSMLNIHLPESLTAVPELYVSILDKLIHNNIDQCT